MLSPRRRYKSKTMQFAANNIRWLLFVLLTLQMTAVLYLWDGCLEQHRRGIAQFDQLLVELAELLDSGRTGEFLAENNLDDNSATEITDLAAFRREVSDFIDRKNSMEKKP